MIYSWRMKLVTSSERKVREWQAMVNIETVSLDIVEIQGTMEEVARDKVMKAYEQLKEPCVVEDISLCFGDTMLPGPYIKDFLRLDKRVLVEMSQLLGHATLYCHIVYHDGQDIHVFCGMLEGRMKLPNDDENTKKGNGLDDVFEVDGFTLGEMTWEQKKRVSHRVKAIEAFLKHMNVKLVNVK